jgi:hypothetical protein
MNLKDAFDQEKFVIDDNEYADEDFQAMSIDDLETLKYLKKCTPMAN